MTEWFQTGGRRARTRISVRETKQRERKRKQATEISVDTGPRLEWPDRALDYLWGTDRVPDRLAGELRGLMWAGTENLGVDEACDDYRLNYEALRYGLDQHGCPPMSKWLRLGQLLAAAELLCVRGSTRVSAARKVGLASGPDLYKSLRRNIGLTPDEVEELPRPRWRAVTERWWGEWAG